MASSPSPVAAGGVLRNRTRRSRSIPGRLVREGKLHLLPLYAILRTSDLAREGMENSGSHRFADHVYRNVPSGRLVIGRWLDAALLRLRGARSMRSRHHFVVERILAAATAATARGELRVLSVPCGIARDLVTCARALAEGGAGRGVHATFFGMDLDPEPLEASRRMAEGWGEFQLLRADAFDESAWPRALDVVSSTGFGEFLDDDELVAFYRLCRRALADEGVFVTSGMRRDRVADWLARELAELRVHYRDAERLRELLRRAGFERISVRADADRLQTLVEASPGRASGRRSDSTEVLE